MPVRYWSIAYVQQNYKDETLQNLIQSSIIHPITQMMTSVRVRAKLPVLATAPRKTLNER